MSADLDTRELTIEPLRAALHGAFAAWSDSSMLADMAVALIARPDLLPAILAATGSEVREGVLIEGSGFRMWHAKPAISGVTNHDAPPCLVVLREGPEPAASDGRRVPGRARRAHEQRGQGPEGAERQAREVSANPYHDLQRENAILKAAVNEANSLLWNATSVGPIRGENPTRDRLLHVLGCAEGAQRLLYAAKQATS